MKTILVTGATDGIGKQTAIELARLGHRVLVHGRNEAKIMDAVADVAEHAVEGAPPQGFRADFSSLHEVQALAGQVAGAVDELDVLLNNAGVFATERRESHDGYELTLAVNHIAPFLLTRELLPVLRGAKHARVVTVASVAHTRGEIWWDDPQLFAYDGYRAYGQSKLANIMFSNALARRVRADGITSNSLHPGVITTKLLRAGFNMDGDSLEAGARTSVHCASDPRLADVTGKYFSDSRQVDPLADALDEDAQERLWTLTERWIADALT